MRKRKRNIAGLLVVLIILFITDSLILCLTGMPRLENAMEQRYWEGMDLLDKYRENQDMVGWLQIEGTSINYPVMRGEKYLHRNFKKERNASGSLFVEEDWSSECICTLIYGHNMWMYGTMLNPLHKFKEQDCFHRNRKIHFYVIQDSGQSAEKRTYNIICCSKTSIDEWNYASCQYISSAEELRDFLDQCKRRAVQAMDIEYESEGAIVLSTCSYHVKGGKGRLLVAGIMTGRTDQTKIDMQQTRAEESQKTD